MDSNNNLDEFKKLFSLSHYYIDEYGEEQFKDIGIYESKELAEQAIERLKIKPGFREYPDGFIINSLLLNFDYWSDGFDHIVYDD